MYYLIKQTPSGNLPLEYRAYCTEGVIDLMAIVEELCCDDYNSASFYHLIHSIPGLPGQWHREVKQLRDIREYLR
jgi:hypothetical protein